MNGSRMIRKAVMFLAVSTLPTALTAQSTAPAVHSDPAAILAQIESSQPQQARIPKPPTRAGWIERSEYSFQVSGVLSRVGGGLSTKVSPGSVGFTLGMRYHINPWEAVEFEVGSTGGPGLAAGGSTGSTPGISRLTRFSLNEVITSDSANPVAPFLIVGGGVVDCKASTSASGLAASQLRPAGEVGLGADIRFVHLGIRLELQEVFYKSPTFGVPATPVKWSHFAQPSVGLIVAF